MRFRDHRIVGGILDLAGRYRDEGADELVFYDISASPEGRSVDKSWVKRVARILDIPFCVAGGISSVEEAEEVLAAGAEKVSINSPALANPDVQTPQHLPDDYQRIPTDTAMFGGSIAAAHAALRYS